MGALMTATHADTATATATTNARLPEIPISEYSDAQKQAAAGFEAQRGRPPYGPFLPLLHSPEVMTLARSMGDYLRYKPSIGTTLSELAILVTAREWSQDYEWFMHAAIAEAAGIGADVIAAIRDGRRPTGMTADEEMVYDFSIELHRNKRVSDATFARVDTRFGKQGIVDLTGINGYYTLLAMQLNVARFEPDGGMPRLPRMPE